MLRATRSNSSKKIPRSLGIGERQDSAILASARGSRKLTAKRIKSVPFDNKGMEAAAEELKGPEAEVDENGDEKKAAEEDEPSSSVREVPVERNSNDGRAGGNDDSPYQKSLVLKNSAPILENIKSGKSVKEWTGKFRHFLYTAKSGGEYVRAVESIPARFHDTIEQLIAAVFDEEKASKWKETLDEDILNFIDNHLSTDDKRSIDVVSDLKKEAGKWFSEWKPDQRSTATRIVQDINDFLAPYGELDPELQQDLVKALVASISRDTVGLSQLTDFIIRGGKPSTVKEFNVRFLRIAKTTYEAKLTANLFGMGGSTPIKQAGNSEQKGGGYNHNKRKLDPKGEGDQPSKKSSKPDPNGKSNEESCNHCGWSNHSTADCRVKTHKFANPDAKKRWSDSEAGKKANEKGHSKLVFMKSHKKGESNVSFNYNLLAILSNTARIYDHTIDGLIYCNEYDAHKHSVKFLLDTCALQANYISVALADSLRRNGCFFEKNITTVCSPIRNCACFKSEGLVSFNLKYLNFSSGKYESILINARVLDIECDLIIGLPSITKYNLVTNFSHLFSAADISHAINLAKVANTQDRSHTVAPPSVLAMLVSEMKHNARIPMAEVLTTEVDYEEEFEDNLPDAPWNHEQIPASDNNNNSIIDELDLVQLEGSAEFKTRLRALLEKYRKVFSMRLRKEPALLEPMSLDVDTVQWQVPANQRGPRLQTDKGREELRRHINNMLDQHIIQPSKAPAFSRSVKYY